MPETVILEENKKVFTRSEVCIMEECSARELIHKARDNGDFSFNIVYRFDKDGFTYCNYCYRISARTFEQYLPQCPTCGRFFKASVRRFKNPIDYDCRDCG